MPERVAQALAAARAQGLDRLDAQVLLAHLLARPRTWLIANDDASLPDKIAQAYRAVAARRAAGVPLAYLTGRREFHGLMLGITPAVLDPRPDTETLVDWAIELLAPMLEPQVLDLGTGSGAIALAVKHACPHAGMHALDASAEALAVARANAERLGLEVAWSRADWWQGYAGPALHLALANPPYIAADDPHLAALAHEPRAALTPGGDGLGALRCIVAGAPAHLRPGAWLLLEHGHEQEAAVRSLLEGAGFAEIATRRDLAGHPRCSGGRWPGRVVRATLPNTPP